jgi:hypothetical protein
MDFLEKSKEIEEETKALDHLIETIAKMFESR